MDYVHKINIYEGIYFTVIGVPGCKKKKKKVKKLELWIISL